MSITGCLSDFTLPEIFQLIEKGQKTGLLALHAQPETQAKLGGIYYIWMYQGRIVAAANRLDDQGLVSLIEKHQWVSDRVFDKVVHWCCPISEPLGLYLKKQGVLQIEQLKRLFQIQVLQQICALFELQDAEFTFEPKVRIPTREMTGLSILPTEAALVGLRVLRKWDALADKLPDSNSGLVSIIAGQPKYRLNAQEWQVWEYTKGTVSLNALAKQLRLPLFRVQQIAFRLIAIGLVEEVPFADGVLPSQSMDSLPEPLVEETELKSVSSSFMQNLVGFLRDKVLTQPSPSSC